MKPNTLDNKTIQWVQSNIEYKESDGAFYYKDTSSLYPSYISKKGYTVIRVGDKGNRVSVYAHRLAWLFITGTFPTNQIDHKDLNKSNNTPSNLREASPQQNNGNVLPRKGCHSKYKGVTKKDSNTFPWRARGFVTTDGIKRQVYLGSYKTEEEAAKAYNDWAHSHFNEYARVNKVA